MAIRHLKPGQDFGAEHFSKDFGFTESARAAPFPKGDMPARNRAWDPGEEYGGDYSYGEGQQNYRRGGRVKKADGGGVDGEPNTITRTIVKASETVPAHKSGLPADTQFMPPSNGTQGFKDGGRIKRADGGPAALPPSGAPTRSPQAPGPAPNAMAGGALTNAQVTMPVSEAARGAAGLLQAGRQIGARQALTGLARAAEMRAGPQRIGQPGATLAPGAQAPMPPAQTGVPAMAKGGHHLTAAARHRLPAKDFALSGERYPIEDASHARNALSRVAQHGSPAEQATVRRKVHAKFPGIGKK